MFLNLLEQNSIIQAACNFLSEITFKYKPVNPLPGMPILGFSNSATNKDNFYNVKNIDKWGIQLSDWVENIVRKREIALYEQFLIFPQCFQKPICFWCVKTSIYGVKG